MSRRATWTESRRARLARRFQTLDQLEPRSTITESLGMLLGDVGLLAASGVFGSLAASELESRHRRGMENAPAPEPATMPSQPVARGALPPARRGTDAAGPRWDSATRTVPARADGIGDWLDLRRIGSEASPGLISASGNGRGGAVLSVY